MKFLQSKKKKIYFKAVELLIGNKRTFRSKCKSKAKLDMKMLNVDFWLGHLKRALTKKKNIMGLRVISLRKLVMY